MEPGSRIILRKVSLDSDDEHQFGGGILGHGNYDIRGTSRGKRFIRLTHAPKRHERTLFLSEPAVGWKPGDKLIVPGTTQDGNWDRTDPNHAKHRDDNERLFIESISSDLLTLTLNRPLVFDHPWQPH
jgi:hypothetical protein